MAKNPEWEQRVKGLLKAELKKRGPGLPGVGRKARRLGIPETERNIANKISRGGFTAVFFVQCLVAIGCTMLRLEDV